MSREQYVPEQHGFSFTRSGQPVQPLPAKDYYHQHPTQRQRHAAGDPRYSQQRQSAGQPKQTYTTTRKPDVDEEIDDEILPSTAPRSALRYRPVAYDVDERVQVAHHYHNQPVIQRRSLQQEPPVRQEYEAYEEEQPGKRRRGVRVHVLVYIGVALLLMLAGWIAFTDLGSWWQTHQDDTMYGNPRTFQIDAVVEHGDSNSNPSHFTAENLKGQIIIVEFPGGDASKARSYIVTTIPGNEGNPPVRLSFQDINHDGKLDLVILIGDPGSTVTIFLLNNGTQFVSKL